MLSVKSTEEIVSKLFERLKRITHLNYASALMSWDLETYIPSAGAKGRAETLATVSTMAFEMFTAPETGALLEELLSRQDKLEPHVKDIVRVCYRDWCRKRAVPPELHRELTRTSAEAQVIWRSAKMESNYAKFEPYLKRLVELNRQMAEHIGYSEERYDALLEEYEPGLKASDFQAMADVLKDGLKELIERYGSESIPLEGNYEQDKQMSLIRKLVFEYMGLPEDRFRIDVSAHPFTIRIGPKDVRITVRFKENDFVSAMYGAIHEAGHASYELGIDEIYEHTPLAEGASYGMHESQSRFWENAIGRSFGFIKLIYPELKEYLNLSYSPELVYRAVNTVKPSLIRVEADETTYNLHIILRFELERMMINDSAFNFKELPELWNCKMREYLGIVPVNDSQGVLQDIHWAFGSFGYFPTYTLGNIYSAQILWKLRQEYPQLRTDEIDVDLLKEIMNWLREKIHRYGRSRLPYELLVDATGWKPSPEYLLNYLREKLETINPNS